MRAILFAAVVLFPAVCAAQALPGGQYIMPSSPAMDSYSPQLKERFTVEVYGPGITLDKNLQRVTDPEVLLSRYVITDSQWPGLKKNIEKFCRQKKLQVAKLDPGSSVQVYLVPLPPPKVTAVPGYEKGKSPAPAPSPLGNLGERKKGPPGTE